MLEPIVFSAPFGNYLGGPHITSTLGTFTLAHRAGPIKRTWRVVKTVRYSPLLGAWVNKLGLPNPGIDSALDARRRSKLRGRLLSIHGFNADEWVQLCAKVGALEREEGPLGIELNVSCPNVRDDLPDYAAIMRAAAATGYLVVVKIPPVSWRPIVDTALANEVTAFHACNTLPVARGGLSGKPLTSINLRVVEELRGLAPDVTIIGGGGVTRRRDVDDYRNAGANHVAIGSGLFWPWMAGRMRRIARDLTQPT